MMNDILKQLRERGYTTLPDIYEEDEVNRMKEYVETNFMHNGGKDVFAIRQLLNQVPALSEIIFNSKLKKFLKSSFSDYFITKGIYFDKPPFSNWFVAYHQDLSISVKKKFEVSGYKNWTTKKNHLGVQPPIEVLRSAITLRIHLDDTNEYNGALRVIPKSHHQGIIRYNQKDYKNEVTCSMKKGDIMLMSPLLLHASSKTTNNKRRRVIHLELNNSNLTSPLEWLEKKELF